MIFKNPYQLCVGVLCMAGYAVLFYHAVWGLYALLGRSRTGREDFPQIRFAAWFAKAPGPRVVAAHRRGVAAVGRRVLARLRGLGLLGGRSRRCLGCRR